MYLRAGYILEKSNVRLTSPRFMTWQTKVAAWAIPLLAEYAIPDNASVESGVDFASLDKGATGFVSSEATHSGQYPGLIPDFGVIPLIEPTFGGLNYTIKVTKAVGFYGAIVTVLSYDPTKLNRWTFPVTRRNFGHIALSRNGKVSLSQPIHYDRQIFIAEGILSLCSNYDTELAPSAIFNGVDENTLNQFGIFQYPGVRTQVAFLPVYETWTVKFFRLAIGG